MLPQFKSVHFIGICGTAMASVAGALQERGINVTGSDTNSYPPMSTFLDEHGIEVQEGYCEGNLADAPDLVVIGNAISRGNPEAEAVLERKLCYCALPELLKETFIRGKRSIVVTGTHGKTTVTSLLTWVFECSGLNPSFLIGGIPNNFSKGARFTDSEWFILEGDEYDTAFFDKRSKFMHYLPEVAIINNLEFDHADIFQNLGQIQTSFRRFINLIPRNGLLAVNGDETEIAPLVQVDHCPITRFGIGGTNDIKAAGLQFSVDGSKFTIGEAEFSIPMCGELNVRNALAAVTVAKHCGLNDGQIQNAFDTFEGIKRRMETRGEAEGIIVVDDFAHHPTAIKETLKALRMKYPTRRLWAIFEPRSNTTRRAVFQEELAKSFDGADQVVISAVAKVDQIPRSKRLDPLKLVNSIKASGVEGAYLRDVPAIVEHVRTHSQPGDVVCFLSNGSFGGIHEQLLEALKA